MKRLLRILVILFSASLSARAQTGAGGFVLGKSMAYFLEAPKGWVMDAAEGRKYGANAVFHPADKLWPDSKVMIYTISDSKSKTMNGVADKVRNTVKMFKDEGSPLKVVKKAPIKSVEGRTAQVYYYTGDKRGNVEAGAYYDEKDCVNFFVLTARDQATFDRSIPLFDSIVRSYRRAKLERDE
jgi:hypothetical protein